MIKEGLSRRRGAFDVTESRSDLRLLRMQRIWCGGSCQRKTGASPVLGALNALRGEEDWGLIPPKCGRRAACIWPSLMAE